MSYRSPQRLLVVAFGGKVFGNDLATGQRVWEYDSGGGGHVRLAVDAERVYGKSSSQLFCLQYDTGHIVWRNPGAYGDTMVLVDGRIILGSDGEVACYSTDNGALLWQDKFKGKGGGFVTLGLPGHVVQADRW